MSGAPPTAEQSDSYLAAIKQNQKKLESVLKRGIIGLGLGIAAMALRHTGDKDWEIMLIPAVILLGFSLSRLVSFLYGHKLLAAATKAQVTSVPATGYLAPGRSAENVVAPAITEQTTRNLDVVGARPQARH